MNKTLLAGLTLAMGIAGCQSNSAPEAARAEQTNSVSQSVYEIEHQFAQQFFDQTAKLESSLQQFCTEAKTDKDAVKQQWHQTMLAWMKLQGQERGPEAALEQSWNIQFWPDKKNTTGRKMAALTNSDKQWTQQQIATQSVTVQGLGALEWLLYDNKSPLKRGEESCSTATAIAGNLHNNAEIIASAWSENPWKTLSDKEWTSEYLSLLSNQLEYSMKKLSRPLAKIGQPRPYFAESWRSETSYANLKSNLQGMQALYFADGKGLDARLRSIDKAELADRIANQFSTALETWPEEQSLFASLKGKEGYRNALAQYNKLEYLKHLIHEEVAIELGVVIGFNATDGD